MEDVDIKGSKFIFLALVFFAGSVFSLSKIGLYLYDSSRAKDTYSGIRKIVEGAGLISENADSENTYFKNEVKEEAILDTFNEMTRINTDYVGFIYIEGTNIQYPIVRGRDNVFYLTHNIYGEKSIMGSIFMDYRNSPDFSDGNTLIYGHNMLDKSMFHDLLKYKDEEFMSKSGSIVIMTKTEVLEYEIFASYKIHKNEYYSDVNFYDEEAFNLYMEALEDKTDVGDISFGDKLLTLSTCENASSNYRYLVHGVLKE